jgi:hypothetical protein
MVFLAVVTLELCAYIYINVMGYVVEWIQACVCTHVPATPFPVEPVVVFFFFFCCCCCCSFCLLLMLSFPTSCISNTEQISKPEESCKKKAVMA